MKKLFFYLFCLLNLVIIVFFWWHNSATLFLDHTPGSTYLALGRLTGLLGEYFILAELILIGRITWVEQIFGFDKMNIVHRWIGYGIITFFLGHIILIVYSNAIFNGISSVSQFLTYAQTGEYLRGIISFVMFVAIIITSIAIIRKKFRYETWYFIHLLTYVAIVLVLGHQTYANGGDVSNGAPLYYWLFINYSILGLVLVFRWVKPFYLYRRHRFFVEKITQESSDVYSIYITGKDIGNFKFRAGQFANLTFLSKGLWFTHPFSFSAAPNGEYLRFTVKNLGDFTNKIDRIKVNTKVILDGPMGLFTENQSNRNKYLLIAGGIGITPIRALIEDMAKHDTDMILLYGNKFEKEIVFRQELYHISDRCNILKCHLAISNVLEEITPNYEKGRIDSEKIIRLAPDFKEREIYICGPSPMMKAVVKILLELGATRSQIHYEKFAY